MKSSLTQQQNGLFHRRRRNNAITNRRRMRNGITMTKKDTRNKNYRKYILLFIAKVMVVFNLWKVCYPADNRLAALTIATRSSSKQLLPKCEASDHAPSITSSTLSSLRWSKRTFPISSVQSHFNCFLDETLCTYYYPADFFDPECGIGKDYVHFIEDAEAMRRNKTLWNYMPSIGFPTLSMNNTCVYKRLSEIKSEGTILLNNREDDDEGMRIFDEDYGSDEADTDDDNDSIRWYSNPNPTLAQSTLKDIGYHNKDLVIQQNGDGTIVKEQLSCMTERITMLHVHKSGGTSLHQAFDRLEASTAHAEQVRHKFYTPHISPEYNVGQDYAYDTTPQLHQGAVNPRKEFEDRYLYKQSLKSLVHHATKYPQEKYQPEQHVIIAVVRDPTERFISSIGQALGGEGSQGNQIGKVLIEECVAGKESSADALKCIAKYVQKHGFWIELHFTPQVIDISFTTMFADVPIGIFSFRNIKTVLDYFGAGNAHSRDGSEEDYRADSILTQMSVDDYDDESLRIVCELYAMDVLMQRSLGMEVERCDPYVPK